MLSGRSVLVRTWIGRIKVEFYPRCVGWGLALGSGRMMEEGGFARCWSGGLRLRVGLLNTLYNPYQPLQRTSKPLGPEPYAVKLQPSNLSPQPRAASPKSKSLHLSSFLNPRAWTCRVVFGWYGSRLEGTCLRLASQRHLRRI